MINKAETRTVRTVFRLYLEAIALFFANIVGIGAGPLAVGMISDALAPAFGYESLRWALLVAVPFKLWAGLHYYFAGRLVKSTPATPYLASDSGTG